LQVEHVEHVERLNAWLILDPCPHHPSCGHAPCLLRQLEIEADAKGAKQSHLCLNYRDMNLQTINSYKLHNTSPYIPDSRCSQQ
jgi:hypothetical protein